MEGTTATATATTSFLHYCMILKTRSSQSVTLGTFMKYIGALNVYVDTQPNSNINKMYICCVFTGNPASIPSISSISGNIITIILGWITSFVINNIIKLYINDNEKSNIEV